MTSAEARFNKSSRPRKPEGSLGRTAQDVHLNSHTAPDWTELEIAVIYANRCRGVLSVGAEFQSCLVTALGSLAPDG